MAFGFVEVGFLAGEVGDVCGEAVGVGGAGVVALRFGGDDVEGEGDGALFGVGFQGGFQGGAGEGGALDFGLRFKGVELCAGGGVEP